ncbi:MAG: hypothetical protein L0229_14745 [Blastocatellia bacterium]|nr:hypothetical protein [Blastocatellia bacterium]
MILFGDDVILPGAALQTEDIATKPSSAPVEKFENIECSNSEMISSQPPVPRNQT